LGCVPGQFPGPGRGRVPGGGCVGAGRKDGSVVTSRRVTGDSGSAGSLAAAVTRAEVCATACAEAWRGDGEILASPIGVIPTIGARLARAAFEPDLLLTDGEAMLGQGTWAIGGRPEGIEGSLPYRAIFGLIYNGKRHVMMIPSQIEPHGNGNMSAIWEFSRPRGAQLRVPGTPGETGNDP